MNEERPKRIISDIKPRSMDGVARPRPAGSTDAVNPEQPVRTPARPLRPQPLPPRPQPRPAQEKIEPEAGPETETVQPAVQEASVKPKKVRRASSAIATTIKIFFLVMIPLLLLLAIILVFIKFYQ